MAYKGQKVQKVMVQPIVSFLMVVKVLFSRYKVLKSGAIGARVWFDISFILLLVTGTTAKHFKCSMIFLSFFLFFSGDFISRTNAVSNQKDLATLVTAHI